MAFKRKNEYRENNTATYFDSGLKFENSALLRTQRLKFLDLGTFLNNCAITPHTNYLLHYFPIFRSLCILYDFTTEIMNSQNHINI